MKDKNNKKSVFHEQFEPSEDAALLYFSDMGRDLDYDSMEHHGFPMDWHSAVEFAYVKSGSIIFHFAEKDDSVTLNKGDGIMIDAGVMHSTEAAEKGSVLECFYLLDDFFEREFCKEIFGDTSIEGLNNSSHNIVFFGSKGSDRKILSTIKEILEINRDAPMVNLSYMEKTCLLRRELFVKYGPIDKRDLEITNPRLISNPMTAEMVHFIHENFNRDINVDDIARAGALSKSECFRLFKKDLKESPISYLLKYRLTRAANMMRESNASVAEISNECGFNNNSYFTKRFKEYFGITPREYMKANHV